MSTIVSTRPFKETEKYKKGHTGEKIVTEMLQKRGWYVIPSYDFSGPNDDKAPKLQGLGNGFVLPDLDISRNGKRKWAEVKTKDEATFTRITQKLEHGIPLR